MISINLKNLKLEHFHIVERAGAEQSRRTMLDMGSISWNLHKSFVFVDDLGILVNLSTSWEIDILESYKS